MEYNSNIRHDLVEENSWLNIGPVMAAATNRIHRLRNAGHSRR